MATLTDEESDNFPTPKKNRFYTVSVDHGASDLAYLTTDTEQSCHSDLGSEDGSVSERSSSPSHPSPTHDDDIIGSLLDETCGDVFVACDGGCDPLDAAFFHDFVGDESSFTF
jgi:hypothetical protein